MPLQCDPDELMRGFTEIRNHYIALTEEKIGNEKLIKLLQAQVKEGIANCEHWHSFAQKQQTDKLTLRDENAKLKQQLKDREVNTGTSLVLQEDCQAEIEQQFKLETDSLKSKIEDLEKNMASLTRRLDVAYGENFTLKNKAETVEGENAVLKREKESLQNEVRVLWKKVNDLETENCTLALKKDEVDNACSEVKKELMDVKSKSGWLQMHKDDSDKKVASLATKLNEKTGKINHLKEQKDKFEMEVNSMKKKYESVELENAELKRKLSNLESKNEKENSDYSIEKDSLDTKIDDLSTSCEAMNLQMSSSDEAQDQSEKEALQREVETLKKTLDNVRAEAKKNDSNLQKQLKDLHSHFKDLEFKASLAEVCQTQSDELLNEVTGLKMQILENSTSQKKRTLEIVHPAFENESGGSKSNKKGKSAGKSDYKRVAKSLPASTSDKRYFPHLDVHMMSCSSKKRDSTEDFEYDEDSENRPSPKKKLFTIMNDSTVIDFSDGDEDNLV